jgi:signal peptidase I
VSGDRSDETNTTQFAAISDEPTSKDAASERSRSGSSNQDGTEAKASARHSREDDRGTGGGSGDEGSGRGGGTRTKARTEKSTARKIGSFLLEMLILVVIAVVLVFLIQTFLGRVFVIPSGSMEQTLHGCPGCTNDRIIADKVVYDFNNPSPGDVVVFKGPPGWAPTGYTVQESSNVVVHWFRQFGAALGIAAPDEYDLVKRVIAVGGETVSCCDSHDRVRVNGKPLDEPYLYYQSAMPNRPVPFGPQRYPHAGEPGYQAYFPKVHVPKGYIFVMGDNRNNSDDSRYQNGGGPRGLVPVDNVIGKARVIIWPPSRWGGVSDHNPQQQAHALGAPPFLQSVPTGVAVVLVWPRLRSRRRRTREGELRLRERECARRRRRTARAGRGPRSP